MDTNEVNPAPEVSRNIDYSQIVLLLTIVVVVVGAGIMFFFMRPRSLNNKKVEAPISDSNTNASVPKQTGEILPGVNYFDKVFAMPGWPESSNSAQILDDGSSIKLYSLPEQNVVVYKNSDQDSWIPANGDFTVSYGLELGRNKSLQPLANPFTRVYFYNRSRLGQLNYDSVYIRARKEEILLVANDFLSSKETILGKGSFPQSGSFLIKFKDMLSKKSDIVEVYDKGSEKLLLASAIPFNFFRDDNSKISVAFEVGRGVEYMLIKNLVVTIQK